MYNMIFSFKLEKVYLYKICRYIIFHTVGCNLLGIIVDGTELVIVIDGMKLVVIDVGIELFVINVGIFVGFA